MVVAVMRAVDVQFLRGGHMGGARRGREDNAAEWDRGWWLHVGMMSAGGPVVDGVWGVERRARNLFQGREHGRLCQGDGDVRCVGLSAGLWGRGLCVICGGVGQERCGG